MNLQVEISNRQILKIALPITAAILVPQVNYITNNIFLGGLGEQPLAVAGITGVYYLIYAVIGFGLNSGLQALISRRAGENRPEEIGALFKQGAIIAMALSVIGILLTYLISPYIFSHTLRNESNVDIAVKFLRIRIWGLPFLYLYQMRNALLVGTNNSRYLIAGTLAETIINIVLDYGLIYGKLGLPEMGFNGAAIASIIAEATGVAVIFVVMHVKGISKQLHLFGKYTYNAARAKLILVQSSPVILQYVISVGSWEFFYILVEHHGDRPLAISNVMRNMFGLFGCVSWAFASTANSMVSNVIGQGLQHRVMELVWKIVKISVGISLCIFLLLNLVPNILLGVYGQDDSFIAEAIPVVRVVSLALLLMAVANIFLNSVLGTGNTSVNLIIEVAAIIIYSAYAYTILEKLNYSITAGWTAEWVYWITIFIPAFLYMRSGKWKKKRI